MPSSPTRHPSSPARRTGQSGKAPGTPPKPLKAQVPSSPRRAQSTPTPRVSARPAPARRHTTQTQPVRSSRPLPALSARASKPSPRRRHTASSPNLPLQRGAHVLIPVPIRARDAESPSFIRAPSGQHVDFVFSPPKKRGLIGRLLDSVEWGDSQTNKPYRYRTPNPKPRSPRPFYKKLLS
ncbi:hypothetical protein JB92DRAFT_3141248 [Gautieria morchelliformis]|nr:hypothetical protein JB92DRAFT_3141248 [Gautieria morchelliformis]